MINFSMYMVKRRLWAIFFVIIASVAILAIPIGNRIPEGLMSPEIVEIIVITIGLMVVGTLTYRAERSNQRVMANIDMVYFLQRLDKAPIEDRPAMMKQYMDEHGMKAKLTGRLTVRAKRVSNDDSTSLP